MKAAEVRIGDLADPEPGSFKIGPFGSSLKKNELVTAGIPVASIENILPNNFSLPFRKFITEEKYQELSAYTVLPSDILVTTMGTIGRAAVVPQNVGRMIIDSHLFRMHVDGSKVLSTYLCYAINGYCGLKAQLEQMARGAIMEGLNTTILKDCVVPLPPLPEQCRIAALLDKADRLRRTRRYAAQLSDTFLQAVFVRMFGEPVRNPMGWDVIPLAEGSLKITDGEHLTPKFHLVGYPIVMAQQVEDNGVNLAACHLVSTKDFEKFVKRCKPQYEDVLLVSRGATIGRNCIVNTKSDFCLMGSVILIKPNRDLIIPRFLSGLLKNNDYNRILRKTSGSTAQQAIYIADVKNLPVLVPPIALQQKFARIAQQFERLRAQQREAERQAEHLFQTLLHRAFSGEL